MGFRHVIGSVLLALLATTAPAQAIQYIHSTVVDAGGNGAQYGVFFMRGPTNRNQSGGCPARSLGEIPTGITTCSTSFNNVSAPTEWQAGDIIIARAPAAFSTDIPFDLRTPGVFTCHVDFQGWSGPCVGKTGLVSGGAYECQFTLPVSGDVTIGAAFSADDCPAIPSTETTTTTTPGTSTTTLPGPLNPLDPLLDVLTDDLLTDIRKAQDFYDWLRKNPVLGFVLPPPPKRASLVGELSALNGTPAGIQAGLAPGQRIVLARGKAKLAKTGGAGTLRLKTTRMGRKLLKARSLADLQLITRVKTKPDAVVSRTTPLSLGN